MERAELKIIRKEIDEALAKIGTAHNITIKTTGGTSYTSNSFKMKIEGAKVNEDGVSEKALADFTKFAPMMGLDADAFGKKFTHKNSTFTIIGIKTNNPVYPVQAVNQNGTIYKFPVDAIKRLLNQDC
jgi:hypothetical protein